MSHHKTEHGDSPPFLASDRMKLMEKYPVAGFVNTKVLSGAILPANASIQPKVLNVSSSQSSLADAIAAARIRAVATRQRMVPVLVNRMQKMLSNTSESIAFGRKVSPVHDLSKTVTLSPNSAHSTSIHATEISSEAPTESHTQKMLSRARTGPLRMARAGAIQSVSGKAKGSKHYMLGADHAGTPAPADSVVLSQLRMSKEMLSSKLKNIQTADYTTSMCDGNDPVETSIVGKRMRSHLPSDKATHIEAHAAQVLRNRNLQPKGIRFANMANNDIPKSDTSSSGKTITLRSHEQLVSREIEKKRSELLSAFEEKLKKQAQLVHQRSRQTYSEQRRHLSHVLSAYTLKFKEIIGYFDDLEHARDLISKLRKENEMLRLQTFDVKAAFANSGKNSLGEPDENETALEKRLIHDNSLPLHELIAFLKERLKFKHQVIRSLHKAAENLDAETARVKANTPNLETAVASNRAVAKAKDMIAAFYTHLIKEKSSDEQEIQGTESKIARQAEACGALEQQLIEKRKSLVNARDNFQRVNQKRDKLVAKYHEEVVQAIAEHGNLITDLTAKATALDKHWIGIRKVVSTSAAELKTHLLQVARCPGCLSMLVNPYILWPCGHILCHNCVLRGVETYEPGSSQAVATVETIKSARKAKAKQEKQVKDSLGIGLGDTQKNSEDSKVEVEEIVPRHLVCIECRNSIKIAREALGDEIHRRGERDLQIELALQSDNAPTQPSEGVLTNSISAQTLTKAALRELTVFQNPFVKKQENFNDHHFAARHRTLARICLILRQYSAELNEVVERFERRSARQDKAIQSLFPSHDEILRSLCSLDSNGNGNPFLGLKDGTIEHLSPKALTSRSNANALPVGSNTDPKPPLVSEKHNDTHVLERLQSHIEGPIETVEIKDEPQIVKPKIAENKELLSQEIARIAELSNASGSQSSNGVAKETLKPVKPFVDAEEHKASTSSDIAIKDGDRVFNVLENLLLEDI